MAVAHLAVKFCLGDQRRHRVHHQHVNRTGAHQGFGNFQGLLAVIRLRDQKVVNIHAELGGVYGIERVLSIHEGRHAAVLLRLGNHLQRNSGFAGRLWPEDLDHTPAREAAHAEGGVEGNRSRGNHGDGHHRALAPQLHDGAFAKLLFDLGHGQVNCPALFRLLIGHKCRSLRAPFRRGKSPDGRFDMNESVWQAP